MREGLPYNEEGGWKILWNLILFIEGKATGRICVETGVWKASIFSEKEHLLGKRKKCNFPCAR